MSKSEAKKELILERGLKVMMTHGYNGTSVKDIVDAAGVPKGSFYNYFDSKETFALDAIDRVASENIQEMRRIFSNTSKPARERVTDFFEANILGCCDNQFRVGCFLGNMCQEMSDNSDRIRERLKIVMSTITGHLASTITQMQNEGDLSANHNPEVFAEFLINAWQGAMMRMKADSCRQPLDTFTTHLNMLFEGSRSS